MAPPANDPALAAPQAVTARSIAISDVAHADITPKLGPTRSSRCETRVVKSAEFPIRIGMSGPDGGPVDDAARTLLLVESPSEPARHPVTGRRGRAPRPRSRGASHAHSRNSRCAGSVNSASSADRSKEIRVRSARRRRARASAHEVRMRERLLGDAGPAHGRPADSHQAIAAFGTRLRQSRAGVVARAPASPPITAIGIGAGRLFAARSWAGVRDGALPDEDRECEPGIAPPASRSIPDDTAGRWSAHTRSPRARRSRARDRVAERARKVGQVPRDQRHVVPRQRVIPPSSCANRDHLASGAGSRHSCAWITTRVRVAARPRPRGGQSRACSATRRRSPGSPAGARRDQRRRP